MAQYVPDNKPVPVEESTAGLVKVIQTAKLDDAPAFYNYDGTTIPW